MARLAIARLIISALLLLLGTPPAFGADRPVIVVTDVDDTIKLTHIVPEGHYIEEWKNILNLRGAFAGIPRLYRSLNANRHTIEYVSGTPRFVGWFARLFVKKSDFPPGNVYARDSLGETILDFKVKTITRLMKERPDADFVLIGDNGQTDPEVYHRIQSDPELSSRVKKVFIHKAYQQSTKDYPGTQTIYYSAADLAVELRELGLIDGSQLRSVLGEMLGDIGRLPPDRLIPYFSGLTEDEIEKRFASLPPQDKDSRRLLRKIAEKLKPVIAQNRRRALSCFGAIERLLGAMADGT